jgi:hypothetical protein
MVHNFFRKFYMATARLAFALFLSCFIVEHDYNLVNKIPPFIICLVAVEVVRRKDFPRH